MFGVYYLFEMIDSSDKVFKVIVLVIEREC